MSEFSESYHLYSQSHDEAIQLLQRAQLRGFVLPAQNNWVTFVSQGETYYTSQALASKNSGILLHFMLDEDSSFHFSIYDATQQICAYSCEWDDEIMVNDMQLDLEYTKLPTSLRNNRAEINRLLHPVSSDDLELLDTPLAYRFADLIGLPHYSWLSYYYISLDLERGSNHYEDLYEVVGKKVTHLQ